MRIVEKSKTPRWSGKKYVPGPICTRFLTISGIIFDPQTEKNRFRGAFKKTLFFDTFFLLIFLIFWAPFWSLKSYPDPGSMAF